MPASSAISIADRLDVTRNRKKLENKSISKFEVISYCVNGEIFNAGENLVVAEAAGVNALDDSSIGAATYFAGYMRAW